MMDIKSTLLGVVIAAGAFFNVPAFYTLMAMLAFDWLTGVNKARVTKELCSSKLGISFEKAFHYTILFAGLHCLSLFVMPQFAIVEQAILLGLCLKELLSVVENIKAVQIIRGQNNPIIDKLIDMLGLDIERIAAKIKDKKVK